MHDAEWGMVVTAAVAVSGFFGAWLNQRARTRAAMLEAATETRRIDVDDRAEWTRQMTARCEVLEKRVGELVKELHDERQRHLALMREHIELQARYDATLRGYTDAQRQIDQLKRELLETYGKET